MDTSTSTTPGYRRIHYCEHEDRRCEVLWNPTTGGYIRVETPIPRVLVLYQGPS